MLRRNNPKKAIMLSELCFSWHGYGSRIDPNNSWHPYMWPPAWDTTKWWRRRFPEDLGKTVKGMIFFWRMIFLVDGWRMLQIYIFCAGCKWWIITRIWLVRWVVFVWWFADKFTWVFVTIVSHMSTWHLVRESTLDVTMSTLFFSIFHLTFAVSDGIDERNPAPIIIHIVNILQFTSICRVIVFHILWTGEWCRTSTEWYPRLQKLCNRTSQTWIDSSHFAGLDWNWSPIRGTPSRRGNNETRGLKEFWLRNAYHQVQPPPSNSHNWRLIGIPW